MASRPTPRGEVTGSQARVPIACAGGEASYEGAYMHGWLLYRPGPCPRLVQGTSISAERQGRLFLTPEAPAPARITGGSSRRSRPVPRGGSARRPAPVHPVARGGVVLSRTDVTAAYEPYAEVLGTPQGARAQVAPGLTHGDATGEPPFREFPDRLSAYAKQWPTSRYRPCPAGRFSTDFRMETGGRDFPGSPVGGGPHCPAAHSAGPPYGDRAAPPTSGWPAGLFVASPRRLRAGPDRVVQRLAEGPTSAPGLLDPGAWSRWMTRLRPRAPGLPGGRGGGGPRRGRP